MFRSLLKLACLTFACVVVSIIAAMAVHSANGYPDLSDYIGTAEAQELSATESADSDSQEAVHPSVKNGIRYVTGGIGDEERDALEAQKNNYNFHLVMSSQDGGFTGNSEVTIDTAKDNILPETVAGPLFYASLTPGKYRVSIAHEGKIKQMTVVITPTKPVYQWVSL